VVVTVLSIVNYDDESRLLGDSAWRLLGFGLGHGPTF
jgi:hypothetical protein